MNDNDPLHPPPLPPEGPRPADAPSTSEAEGSSDQEHELSNEARAWLVAAHLLPLLYYPLFWVPGSGAVLAAPLVIARLRGQVHPLVADQAREAFQFQLAVAALTFVLGLTIIGGFVAWIVVAAGLVMAVLAAARACDGERYRYPWIPRWLD